MRSFIVFVIVSYIFHDVVNSFTLIVPRTTSTTNYIDSSRTCLTAAVTSPLPTNDDGEETTTYQYLMNQARRYAYSDTTTPNEAKQYLRHILELQSNCVAGNIIDNAICDNITELVDIVAHLRQKANQKQALIASSKEMLALTSLVSIVALSTFATHIIPSTTNPDVVPFTLEEWRWAIRDGYFSTMVAHYIRNGGL